MYIIKNAFRCIGRSKGRNILIGIIALVIAISACIGLSIRQASENAKTSALEGLSITATISYDRANAMGQMGGGRPGGMGGGRPGGMGGGMGGSSNGSIRISGGTLYVKASGDGIDANGTLTISGGHTTVVGPTRGDTATLDYDASATITGGTFIGTGAAGMAQTFSESQQGVIAVSVGNQTEGTQVTLTDADGNTVVSFAPELSFAVVILSSPEIVKGETYTICVGTETGDVQAG